MKKIMLSLSLMAVIVFTGCSSKNEEVVESVVINVDNSKDSLNDKLRSVYFDFDKYNLLQAAKDTTTRNAEVIKSSGSTQEIIVTGNTDEWGSDEYNYALGLKRAEAVKEQLIADKIPNVRTVSLGESSPVCAQKTKECWAENRRVDFKAE